ncbi:unnamed protein product [Nippostrongylus brasiliensis]|uniref:Secreted protein n=1 Tax=Nippostrongylus brasiliensis TaxID=27835 RepID=A0A0N4YES8_NIPBR|nr:unnamed protein product [Nippostrongylus brasiliensis]
MRSTISPPPLPILALACSSSSSSSNGLAEANRPGLRRLTAVYQLRKGILGVDAASRNLSKQKTEPKSAGCDHGKCDCATPKPNRFPTAVPVREQLCRTRESPFRLIHLPNT